MKIFTKLIIICLFINNITFAQVGIGTTSPDLSSVLDIQSTTGGILIPRMTSAQRTSIISPGEGLMVFDTDLKSVWVYDSGWRELYNDVPNSLVDADNDTKVGVEQTADSDEINFTTAGKQRMKIDANGVIIMGDTIASPVNYTKITKDGSLSYVGEATRWDDLKVPVNSVKVKNVVDEAVFAEFHTGLLALKFQDIKDEGVVFTVQMPHTWLEGSTIYPHVHWSINDVSGTSTNTVKWDLKYSWANVGETFSSPTTISGNTSGIVQYENAVTAIGSGITATGKKISSMIICELSRDTSDSYAGDVFLLEIDFHFEIDSDGSKGKFTKWTVDP